MVPKIPPWYIEPAEVETIVKHAIFSSPVGNPMRNFMLRGPAGSGKTKAAKAVAAKLGLPYVAFTCSAGTDIMDLVGSFVPVPDEKAGIGDKGEAHIKYVDSQLLQAVRNGWVVEIQEPNCIKDPGTMVGLNSILEFGQGINLPTGEYVRRHRDCVMIVTTNQDYLGCRGMNQSVISRMNLVIEMPNPDPYTMLQRAMAASGYADERVGKRMVAVVRDIIDQCKRSAISDGTCGLRELIAWMTSTMVTGDPYESAMVTVITTATAEPEAQQELIASCLDRQFVSRGMIAELQSVIGDAQHPALANQ